MKEIILAKYGEMALKGLNKNGFEDILLKNIRRRLKPLRDTEPHFFGFLRRLIRHLGGRNFRLRRRIRLLSGNIRLFFRLNDQGGENVPRACHQPCAVCNQQMRKH